MTKAIIPAGIRITDLWRNGERPGNRWLAEVRDAGMLRKSGKRGGYLSQTFADDGAALTWAKKEQLRILTGSTSATAIEISALGTDYIASLKAHGRTERHQNQVQQVIDGLVHTGATDPRSPDFKRRVETWLGGLNARPRGRAPKGPEAGERMAKRIAKPASGNLKNKFLIIARAIVEQAVGEGFPWNPLKKVRRFEQLEHHMPVFSIPDLRKLLSDEHAANPWHAFTMLAAYTGCRASEVRALRWSHIDWQAGVIRLPADHPGNKLARDRRIPLQHELAEWLKAKQTIGNHVIVPERVANMTEANITNAFKKYCKRCGVTAGPRRGPHALRHSVASLLTACGMPDFMVMGYIGDRSTQVCAGYASGSEEYHRRVDGWKDGEFFLRRDPPVPLKLVKKPRKSRAKAAEPVEKHA